MRSLGLLWRLRGRLTSLLFVSATGAVTVSQLCSSVVIMHYVIPDDMGIWNAGRLAQTYAMFLLVGVLNGLGRELPFFQGSGETDACEGLVATSRFCVRLASGFVIAAGLACLLTMRQEGAKVVLTAASVMLLIVTTFYNNYYTVLFRSNDAFQRLALVRLVEAFLTVITLPLVVIRGYEGFLVRGAVVSLIPLGFLCRWQPMRVGSGFNWSSLRQLMATGLPFFGVDYGRSCAATTDRVALLNCGGTGMVGNYALASTSMGAIQALASSVSQYIFPRMCYQYGKKAEARRLWATGARGAAACFLVGMVLATGAWLALRPVVATVAPRYLPGVTAAQLAICGAAFEGLTVAAQIVYSMKVWKTIVAYQAVNSCLLALGPFALLWAWPDPLTAVATGFLVAAILRGLVALGFAFWATHRAS